MDPSDTFIFPDSILAAADKITLKDVLDAPFSQPWIVSALANAAYAARQQDNPSPQDIVLASHVDRLVRSIPQGEKLELYRQCSTMVQARKLKHKQRNEGTEFVKEQN